MKKLLPYIVAGAVSALALFFFLKIAFPGGSSPEVKRLAAQVDTLTRAAQALQDTVNARDARVARALNEIAQVNTQLTRVQATNSLILAKLKQDWRVRDKTDAELIAGLNRAHNDSTLLKSSGPIRR
jgi:outer membrane murein-binding lipoprotein Lpp